MKQIKKNNTFIKNLSIMGIVDTVQSTGLYQSCFGHRVTGLELGCYGTVAVATIYGGWKLWKRYLEYNTPQMRVKIKTEIYPQESGVHTRYAREPNGEITNLNVRFGKDNIIILPDGHRITRADSTTYSWWGSLVRTIIGDKHYGYNYLVCYIDEAATEIVAYEKINGVVHLVRGLAHPELYSGGRKNWLPPSPTVEKNQDGTITVYCSKLHENLSVPNTNTPFSQLVVNLIPPTEKAELYEFQPVLKDKQGEDASALLNNLKGLDGELSGRSLKQQEEYLQQINLLSKITVIHSIDYVNKKRLENSQDYGQEDYTRLRKIVADHLDNLPKASINFGWGPDMSEIENQPASTALLSLIILGIGSAIFCKNKK